jgi:hypothetical protein
MIGSDERFEEWYNREGWKINTIKAAMKAAWEAGQRDFQDYP